MLTAIAKPFGQLMLWLYNITGSYGLAIILFALIVNMILLPFMWKSKKSMMRTTRLQPKIAELQKKHEGNQQKLNEEMARLYREEKAHPMSGCLWSLIPFPILIALYQAIVRPITVMMGVSADLLAEGGAIYEKLAELGYSMSNYTTGSRTFYEEIYKSKFITEHFSEFAPLSDKLQTMQYHFLGLDISTTPNFRIWEFDFSSPKVWIPVLGLFLIPFIAAFMSWLSMKVSMSMNPQTSSTSQQQSANKGMAMMMPLMSVWFCFIMPAAMGVYWIINSLIGIVRDSVLTSIFKRQLDIEDADRNAARSAKEAELERKRQETERLRAENATIQNKNTSKKKMQASQKQKDEERRAAADRADRAERRARLGIADPEKPASQSGNRRYARGRAYVEERFIDPEAAEEATIAAAAESEFGESIDSSVVGTEFDTMPVYDEESTVTEEEALNELPEEDPAVEAEDAEGFDDEDNEEQV